MVVYQWVIVGERRGDGKRPCVLFGYKEGGDPEDPSSYSMLSGSREGLPRVDRQQFDSEVADTLPSEVRARIAYAMDQDRALVFVEEGAGVASAQEVLQALADAGLVVHRV